MNKLSENKRRIFSVEEKANIIWRLEAGESNKKLAQEFSVSHSTISTIFKGKEKTQKSFEESKLKRKKNRNSQHEDIESALLSWFKTQRSVNVPISGPILQKKADDFAKLFGKKDFVCSSAWIQRFRARHEIVSSKISGEAKSVPAGVVDDWLNVVWPKIREGYLDEEIFNIDETALFYKMLPDRTLKFKREKCVGGKLSKERITVLVGANFTGTKKSKLLIIGKSKNPRCFKNIKKLPVLYENNSKSWMTSQIFEKYVRNWDTEARKRGEKILLLVDNCPAHPNVDNLRAIKLVFLPPNTTSLLQPMDQGVIKSLKVHYRKLMVLNAIQKIENKCDYRVVNLLDAILLISKAWERVTESTIANCYSHAGFKSRENVIEIEDFEELDDLPLNQWIRQISSFTDMFSSCTFEDFVAVDKDVISTENLSDEDIVACLQSENIDEQIEEDEGNY